MLTAILCIAFFVLGNWLGRRIGWDDAWTKADQVYEPYIPNEYQLKAYRDAWNASEKFK